MGIINVTPDSFSQDGCLQFSVDKTITSAERKARRMVRDGADILDIGGESTRPGARRVSVKDEIKRVVPLITRLSKKIAVPISVDTYKTEVAKHALDAGAVIVNNIMGNPPDTALLKMVKRYNAAVVLMHIKGTPRTMQKNIDYADLIGEIRESLGIAIEKCLEIGINSDRIIIDPGIGFGKTVEDNLQIINRLSAFNSLKKPLLMGTSRKSFIGKVLNQTDASRRLTGTISTVCASILRGAHIVRVHDVKEMKQTALITDAILNKN